MSRQQIKTGEVFEFDSFWRIPTGQENSETAQGRLKYHPVEGIELAVVDLRHGGAGLLDRPTPIPVLHGHDLQGKPCTLFDSIPVSTEGNLFGGHVREVLHSNRLVYGAHLDSMRDLEIGHAIVDLWGMTEWVNGIWETDGPVDDAQARRFLTRLWARLRVVRPRRRGAEGPAELPEGEVLNIPLDGAHLILQRGVATHDGKWAHDKRKAKVTAQFKLTTPVAYDEFSERFVRPLQDLMVLTTHGHVEIDGITILVPHEEEKWWGDREPIRTLDDVSIVERTRFDRRYPRGALSRQIPMPLRAWGNEAPDLIRRWFSFRHELGGPANLLFATLSKENATLEPDVLNLLSVAEGYHRRTLDVSPFAAEIHAQVLSLLGGIDDETVRDHYVVRLKYANEQSQKQRVRALFDRAEVVLPQVEGWRRMQLQPLIDTRNFLTHWGAPTGAVLNGWDLWAALNRVRIVLEINLFIDIGVDHETIGRAIGIGYHGRDFINGA